MSFENLVKVVLIITIEFVNFQGHISKTPKRNMGHIEREIRFAFYVGIDYVSGCFLFKKSQVRVFQFIFFFGEVPDI
jgi:hypothetical protein